MTWSWAEQIRHFRRLGGLTQAQLADRLGVDQSTLSRWERGTHSPDIAIQKRLKDLLWDNKLSHNWMLVNLIRYSLHKGLLLTPQEQVLAISAPLAFRLGLVPAEIVGQSFRPYLTLEMEQAIALRDGSGWHRGEVAYIDVLTRMPHRREPCFLYGIGRCHPIVLDDGSVATLIETSEASEEAYMSTPDKRVSLVTLDQIVG